MQIVSLNNGRDLDALEDDWNRLCEPELQFVPSFSQLRDQLRADGSKYRLLVAIDNSEVKAIACFLYKDAIKRFEVATRRLFDLSVREVSLFGACIPGQPDEELIRRFFRNIVDGGDFDLVSLGDILVDSPLYKAITSLRGIVAWRIMRSSQLRWMIRLPRTFDEYFGSLRDTARKHIGRDFRRFERQQPELRVINRPEEVEAFLCDAEKVSRLTYQWNLGYRVCNDETTRHWFTGMAENGVLRCYLVYIGGRPCAFGWGELAHRTFSFRATGYDPEYRSLSVGTGLMLRMARDLIENTNCQVFDFWGGSDSGYKSRLGNLSPACARMQLAQIHRPYPMMLATIDVALNIVKQAIMGVVEKIAGHGALKRRIKSALRPFGVGSY